ncbi:MAG: sigma-70 family RNA polymerase sigma factor [Oscillospiraceae bacterium]|jgi:RNA polymerase sigma-70 factor (ECF subfamily)|nr:sigma-70 family RNA polymerase sigma factor [Oscillospiraceae bacterium]
MDDRAVIEQVLAGDNDAFGILVERYQTKIYNLALRMCGNEDDAFDLAQESFLRAWRNLGSFQFESAFSTWLFRLCSNICLDFLRAKKRRAAVSLTMTDDEGEENQLEVPDPGKTPEEAVFAAEDRELLTRALNELPADQREILTLRAIDDLSYSEIARILNLQEGTVKSRLSRARTALRKKLLQIGNKTKTESSVP